MSIYLYHGGIGSFGGIVEDVVTIAVCKTQCHPRDDELLYTLKVSGFHGNHDRGYLADLIQAV